MLSEIIENSGANDSTTSADEVDCFLSEPLVDYKVGSPLQ